VLDVAPITAARSLDSDRPYQREIEMGDPEREESLVLQYLYPGVRGDRVEEWREECGEHGWKDPKALERASSLLGHST